MKILICIVILPVVFLIIFMLMALGLSVINEIVEDLKKINKMRKKNE